MTTTNDQTTCLNCKNWNLKAAQGLAKHGFGVCVFERLPGKTISERMTCERHEPAPADQVQARVAYIEKPRSKKNSAPSLPGPV